MIEKYSFVINVKVFAAKLALYTESIFGNYASSDISRSSSLFQTRLSMYHTKRPLICKLIISSYANHSNEESDNHRKILAHQP